MNNHRLCYQPQIKINKKRQNSVKNSPYRVRKMSALGPSMIQDIVFTHFGEYLFETQAISIFERWKKNWIGKTAFLALQQQATAMTVKILYTILTLFSRFSRFFSVFDK